MSKGANKSGTTTSITTSNSNKPLEVTQANQLVLPSKDEVY